MSNDRRSYLKLLLLGLNADLLFKEKGKGQPTKGASLLSLVAKGPKKGHVARGESQNPIVIVIFSFLFINRKERETGHYGKT